PLRFGFPLWVPPLQEAPGSRAFHAACLHSTPPRLRITPLRVENRTRSGRRQSEIYAHRVRRTSAESQSEYLVSKATGDVPRISLAFMVRLTASFWPRSSSE